MKHVLRTAVWFGTLTAALAGLLTTGDRLRPPPVGDLASAWTWLQQTDPATATFSLLRLAAIAVAAYLLLVTSLLVVAQATRQHVLIAASTRLTLPAARRLVRHALGAGLALGMATSTAPMVAGAQAPTPTGVPGSGPVTVTVTVTTVPAPDLPPVLQRLDDDLVLVHLGAAPPSSASGPDAGPTTSPPTDPPGAASTSTGPRQPPPDPMTAVGPAAPPEAASAPTSPAARPPDPPSGVAEAAPPSPPPPDLTDEPARVGAPPSTRTIVTGDHLWGIAEQTLRDAWGAAPDPDDVSDYLHGLIERNRWVLAVPDDPDLVFPGQVFTLPPVPAR